MRVEVMKFTLRIALLANVLGSDFFKKQMPCKHMYMLRRLNRGKFDVIYPDSDSEEVYDSGNSTEEDDDGDSSKEEDSSEEGDEECLNENPETRVMHQLDTKEQDVQVKEESHVKSIEVESNTVHMTENNDKEEPQTYATEPVTQESSDTIKNLILEVAFAEISRLSAALADSESARRALETQVTSLLVAPPAHTSAPTASSSRGSAAVDKSIQEIMRIKLEEYSRESLSISSDEEDQDINEDREAIIKYLNAVKEEDHSQESDKENKKRKLYKS